jgi:hypothetical protein
MDLGDLPAARMTLKADLNPGDGIERIESGTGASHTPKPKSEPLGAWMDGHSACGSALG